MSERNGTVWSFGKRPRRNSRKFFTRAAAPSSRGRCAIASGRTGTGPSAPPPKSTPITSSPWTASQGSLIHMKEGAMPTTTRSPSDFGPHLVSLPERDMRHMLRRMIGQEDTIRYLEENLRQVRIELALRTRPGYRGVIYEVL